MPGRNPPNNLPLPQPQSYEEWTAVLRTELELTESFLADTLEMGVSIERELTETKFRLAEAEILAEAEREEAKRKLAEAERKVAEGENLRKKLHNTIMELKGNIRVFCRVRPLLPSDGTVTEPVISYPTSTGALGRVGRGIDLISSGQKHPFTFDKVFNADVSQQIVFEEISQLVQSALDGYKVCIFAYGQTGSGKTYTMMGTENDEGLIPRSLEQIFKTNLLAHGWNMQVSMLEIYNDTIRDLLTTNDSSRTENSAKRQKKSAIRHAGNTLVNDLTVVDVSNEQITGLLHRASKSRSVGKTDMNEESSRSHFVLTLRMSGVNKATKQQVQGVLNLIDLAGSERVSKSRVTEDRFKETQAINKSLSSLADVIQALAKKDDYVPYRNSKLTHLLQPYLSGDSKTLMFVNISPDPSSAVESLCSLRFAATACACEIGSPRR